MDSVVKAIERLFLFGVILLIPSFAAEPRAPVILNSFPTERIVEAGVPVRFEVEATGEAPLSYRWILRGTNLPFSAATADVVFQNNEGSQDVLNVVVYNRYGNAYRQCVVQALNKPKITIEPTDVAVLSGGSFYLTMQGPVTGIQWLKGGSEIPGETNYYLLRTNVTVTDAGEYRVAGKNEIGTTLSDPTTIRVLAANSPPVVFDPPAELHLLSGATKSIDANAVGWSVAIDLHRQDGSVVTAGRFGGFEIEAVPGEFYFVARNDFGSSTSHVSKVVVHPPEAIIVLSGSSQTQTNLIEVGERLDLSVDLLQGENVRYQWYYDTYAIPRATSSNLHVTDKFDSQFGGRYELRATNEVSVELRTFEVWIDGVRDWLFFPVNGWAGENGETVYLSAIPNYSEPPVQWYRNGQPLAGETNYTLQFTLSADTLGTYHIVKHDARGDYASNPANVIFRHMTNAARDYRLVADVSLQPLPMPPPPQPQQLLPVFGGIKRNVITLVIDGSLYRWSGALERLVDRQTSLPPFRDGHWKVTSCSAEEDGAISFLAESDDGFPLSAVFERSVDGLKIIAQSGDLIAERPTVSIQAIRNVVRAGGKIAMEIFGMDGPFALDSGYHGLHVWDGTNLTRWADSTDPTIEGFSLQTGIGFDGESIAISAQTGKFYGNGIYKITPVSIERIIGRYDRIPGLTSRFGGATALAVNAGKVLFSAYTDEGHGYWISLYEYSPAAEQRYRLIAKPGAVTGRGLSLMRLQSGAAYGEGGSILFSAMAGGFIRPGYDTNMFPFGLAAYGVFRERNGVISEELTSWDRVGGREIGMQVAGADGTNYVLTGSATLGYGFSYYTTLPGLPRPENTRVNLIDRGSGKFDTLWNDGGRLQRSHDLVNWKDILAAPGVVTNDFSQNAEFLRVYHP